MLLGALALEVVLHKKTREIACESKSKRLPLARADNSSQPCACKHINSWREITLAVDSLAHINLRFVYLFRKYPIKVRYLLPLVFRLLGLLDLQILKKQPKLSVPLGELPGGMVV